MPEWRATYRLQLRGGTGFAQAGELVPYLAGLGVSHLYLSPPFKAVAGSSHGYDVADPNVLEPELGGREGFEALARTLRAHGMGLLLDIVPNHMGIGPDNPWWQDLLTHGEGSRYARFFDVDLNRDPERKLVLPVLGQPAEAAIAAGELRVEGDSLAYFGSRFPLHPDTPKTDDAAVVLAHQRYRLIPWQEGGARRNYRRFFDINDLAGLRIEDPEVFEAAHALIFELIANDLVQGLRVDHIDGLTDPAAYLERLDARLREIAGQPIPVWVEKIVIGEERLPPWPIAGTTGYEALNHAQGLFVDPAGIALLEQLRQAFTGEERPFPEVAALSKRLVLERLFPGELKSLAERAAKRLDLDPAAVAQALTALLVAFPVYRTYRTPGPLSPADRAVLEPALDRAATHLRGAAASALERLRALLTAPADGEDLAWIAGFQQLSGPVTAKALEDTAFYRFPRLLALNEVGGEPDGHGLSPADLHARHAERLEAWPRMLLATATHDTKRGEDARARLLALSEAPARWALAVRDAKLLNAALPAIHPEDEYTYYQALLGAWPTGLAPGDKPGLERLASRLRGFLEKSLREAKRRSSWTEPDAPYEAAVQAFMQASLDPDRSSPFLRAFAGLVDWLAPVGAATGLAQLLLKLTAPGIPDLYQGSERWDWSLVDPDNRRAVDWEERRLLLERGPPVPELLAAWPDGGIKQHVMASTLACRRDDPALFAAGAYLPLRIEGEHADHAFAFARRQDDRLAITLLGRHLAPFLAGTGALAIAPGRWADTALLLPDPHRGTAFKDRLTGRNLEPAGGRLALAAVLKELPVALLVADG